MHEGGFRQEVEVDGGSGRANAGKGKVHVPAKDGGCKQEGACACRKTADASRKVHVPAGRRRMQAGRG